MSTNSILNADPAIINQYLSQLSDEELEQLGLKPQQAQGAPADFGGAVFSMPEGGVKISDDTEPGGEPTRLPAGVSLHRENFNGAAPFQTVAAGTVPKLPPGAVLEDTGDHEIKLPPGATLETAPGSESNEKPVPADSLTRAEDRIHESAQTLGREAGAAIDTITGIPGALWHAVADAPTAEEIKSLGVDQSGPAARVANTIQRLLMGGQIREAARFYRDYVKASPEEKRKIENSMLDVAPEAIGAGAGAVLTPKILEQAPAVLKTARELPGKVADAAGSIRPTARAVTRTAANVIKSVDPDVVGIVSPRAAHTLKVAQRAAKVAQKYAAEKPPAEPEITPSEAEPHEGVTSPQTEHAAATEPESAAETPESLKESSASAAETPAEILNQKGSPAELQQLLNDALGGKPLKKGVPLRSQGTAKGAAASSLPEGFTPVDSSVLKGYKYDPATQKFDAVTNSGQHYAHGEVTPELFQKFLDADSKGVAWNELRKSPGVVQTEKNFQPSKPGTIANEAGEIIPKSKAGMQSPVMQKAERLGEFIRGGTGKTAAKAAPAETSAAAAGGDVDLLNQLKQSLDQVQAGKGGVLASAKPADLLDRWGVDPESFAEGREQTRGMKPGESAADLKRLSARYKKGEPVEPVMETRDKDNNIIEVDGRGRALAAHQAGIDRIPIIVRRLRK